MRVIYARDVQRRSYVARVPLLSPTPQHWRRHTQGALTHPSRLRALFKVFDGRKPMGLLKFDTDVHAIGFQ